MSRCLVLGGKGFIGSHLVDALVARGHPVRCFDRPHLPWIGDEPGAGGSLEFVEGDFTSEADIAAALDECDVCFHLVSTTLPRSSNLDPVYDVESNVLSSLRLLRHAHALGVKRVIFASSGGTVYGRPLRTPIDEEHPTQPICSYGIAKLAIEKYLALFTELHGVEHVTLRLSNPYGPRQRVQASQGAVAVFLGRALKDETIEIWGDGEVVRDYLHISDVTNAMIAALEYRGDRQVFNIGYGEGMSLNGILRDMEALLGRPVRRTYSDPRPFDVPVSVLCNRLAEAELGWRPKMTFAEGLASTHRWLATSR
jgi:UDP-glucose 4-epimerase